MAQIIVPQKQKSSNSSSMLPAVGALGGALIGGLLTGGAGAPAGAALGGAALGSSLGGAAGTIGSNFVGSNSNPSGGGAIPNNVGQSQLSAMSRRQQAQSQDSLAALTEAEAALPHLPEPLRQEYAAPIIQARMMEQRNRGIV